MENRVILDNMDGLGRPQGSYPESFLSISLLLADWPEFWFWPDFSGRSVAMISVSGRGGQEGGYLEDVEGS